GGLGGRWFQLKAAAGLGHVPVADRSPVGELGPLLPAAAEIEGDADIAARRPEAHPLERGGLPAAVDMEHARQLRALARAALDGEDANTAAFHLLAREAERPESRLALVPRPDRFDFERQRLGIEAAPEVLDRFNSLRPRGACRVLSPFDYDQHHKQEDDHPASPAPTVSGAFAAAECHRLYPWCSSGWVRRSTCWSTAGRQVRIPAITRPWQASIGRPVRSTISRSSGMPSRCISVAVKSA